MNPFYDLNKRLADLSAKQDATQLVESKQAEAVAKSPLTQALSEAGQRRGMHGEPEFVGIPGPAKGTKPSPKAITKGADREYYKSPGLMGEPERTRWRKKTAEEELDEAGYSAKSARAGHDIGKPGKNFAKIAKSAGAKYGSKAAGERVAGAVLNKLRKGGSEEMEEGILGFGLPKFTVDRNYLSVDSGMFQHGGNEAGGKKLMAALQKANPQLAAQGKHYGSSGPDGQMYMGIQFANPQLAQQAAQALQGGMEEGNAFTGKLKSTPQGGKFKLGNKSFKDTSSIEENKEPRSKGTAFDPEVMSKIEKEKDTHPRHDVKDTGYSKRYTRKHEDDVEKDDDDSKSNQASKYASPKKKGRPQSAAPKDSERVTKGSHKYDVVDGKRVKKVKENEEYDDEGSMAKGDMHTVIRHATELEKHLKNQENLPTWVIEKIGQIKGMMTSVSDYILSQHERGAEQATGQEGIRMGEGWRGGGLGEPSVVKTRTPKNANAKVEAWEGLAAIAERGAGMDPKVQAYLKQIAKTLKPEDWSAVEEVAPPGAKAERMVKGIKKSLSKDGHLSNKDKAIAYATTWKAHNQGKVEEESTDTKDQHAEKAGKKVTKDLEYDMKHKSKDDAKAEKAGKKVTKDIEYDDKKVDETTTSGSVATATPSGKSSKGGMKFGQGVYESFNNSLEKMISESIDVTETVNEHEQEGKTITVTASGPEADMLMQLLKAAGLSGQGQSQGCGCGTTPCSCETVDEAYGDTDETLNNPDWPTDTEKSDNAFQYSGGLNGPKSTGQTTTVGGGIPNMQARRQVSMEENVKLERSLFKTWKNYKG